jgi:hypothetical protein
MRVRFKTTRKSLATRPARRLCRRSQRWPRAKDPPRGAGVHPIGTGPPATGGLGAQNENAIFRLMETSWSAVATLVGNHFKVRFTPLSPALGSCSHSAARKGSSPRTGDEGNEFRAPAGSSRPRPQMETPRPARGGTGALTAGAIVGLSGLELGTSVEQPHRRLHRQGRGEGFGATAASPDADRWLPGRRMADANRYTHCLDHASRSVVHPAGIRLRSSAARRAADPGPVHSVALRAGWPNGHVGQDV